jgi:aminoglycoside phosphotransferase (APT) family kinase protein
MNSPWQPEREVSLGEARQAVRSCGLAADDVRIVAAGWDNTIVRVDDDWVFRFPRRAIALPGIDREIALLPQLDPLLSLPIPVPEHVGTYGDPPWRFWGARYLSGTELAITAQVDTVAVGAAIGRFLSELHSLPADPRLPIDPFGRGDAADRAIRARRVLDDLAELDVNGGAVLYDVLAAGESAGPPPAETVLSHGDLYARHVLVDLAGQAAAVIDWGDLCVAPRSVDLSIAFSAFHDDARAAFFSEYGGIDSETELRARVMAIFSAAIVASYAKDIGHPDLMAHALDALTFAAR